MRTEISSSPLKTTKVVLQLGTFTKSIRPLYASDCTLPSAGGRQSFPGMLTVLRIAQRASRAAMPRCSKMQSEQTTPFGSPCRPTPVYEHCSSEQNIVWPAHAVWWTRERTLHLPLVRIREEEPSAQAFRTVQEALSKNGGRSFEYSARNHCMANNAGDRCLQTTTPFSSPTIICGSSQSIVVCCLSPTCYN